MGIVFYNALMVNITPLNKTGLISGLGKMFGYIGAILSLYLIRPIVLKEGYQATFVPTGLLFLIFSLPCLIFVKDKLPEKNMGLLHLLRKDNLIPIFKTVRPAIFNIYKAPGISEFLKSAFFGLASVNVVILFMSVYATKVFHLHEVQVTNLIVFSTFFAIFGSIFSGFISDLLGYKLSLALVYILWIICFSSGALAKNINLYFLIGALTGFSLGSTWVISRALAISLVPGDKVGEVFGLFNLVGYLSGILGALFWGLILLAFGSWGEASYRLALISLNLFMFLGFYFLLRIPNVIFQGSVTSGCRRETT
jgi:UMF1 family MFS transporter